MVDWCRSKIGQSSLFGIYRQISKGYGFLENKLKSFVQHKIARGKVDVTVTIEHVCDTQLTVQVNESLARGYVQALKTLAQQYHLNQEIDAVSIADYPDVLTVYKEQEDEEVLWNAVQQVSETAFLSYA